MTEWYGLVILSSGHLVILSIPCLHQNRLPGLICIATLPALRFPLAGSRLEATLLTYIRTRGGTMTAPLTSDAFLELVRKSGLIEQDRLDRHLERRQALAPLPTEPMELPTDLIR